MTREIHLGIAGLEHAMRQPLDRRYALFCKDALGGVNDLDCEATRRGGHIGDFVMFSDAKRLGIDHPHAVLIRFFPDSDNTKPSDDFLEEFKNLPPDRKVS